MNEDGTDRLQLMLEQQDNLQRESYQLSPTEMTTDERVQYIMWNVLALTSELHELLNETSWKPWTHGPEEINSELGMNELVDAWHFLMNLALALNPGRSAATVASQLYAGYLEKRGINARRQRVGYDGSTKCPGCARELDRLNAMQNYGNDKQYWRCASCFVPLPDELIVKVQS